jgi:hypothetical protein
MTSDAIAALRERLSAAGYKVQQASIADRDALVARRADFRLEWMATRVHTFVVAFVVDALEEALAAALSSAARQYAIDHKGGLPRGLQTGTATIAVFITNECEQTTRSWFGHEPERRFAALLAPVLVEVGTRQVTYFSRLKYGSVYSDYLHALVENVIAPGYRFSAGLADRTPGAPAWPHPHQAATGMGAIPASTPVAARVRSSAPRPG